MGGKQSKLRSEIERLKTEAAQSNSKLQKDIETLQNEKRTLEFKLGVLEEMAAHAQLEAEKATQKAVDCEERAEALKWELVRHLSVPIQPTNGVKTAPVSSLSPSTSLSPQVSMRWKLKDDVKLRRSSTHILSKSTRTRGPEERISTTAKVSEAKATTNQTEQVIEQKETSKELISNDSVDTIDTFVSAPSSSSSSDEDEIRGRTNSMRAKR